MGIRLLALLCYTVICWTFRESACKLLMLQCSPADLCGSQQLYADKCILYGERTACLAAFVSPLYPLHGQQQLSLEDLS